MYYRYPRVRFQNDLKLDSEKLSYLITKFDEDFKWNTINLNNAIAYYNFEEELIKNKYESFIVPTDDIASLTYISKMEIKSNTEKDTVQSKIDILESVDELKISKLELCKSNDFKWKQIYDTLTYCKASVNQLYITPQDQLLWKPGSLELSSELK